jgi:peptidoglycan/xylan/chitin deacetylase (PgdA/CDA1 family)
MPLRALAKQLGEGALIRSGATAILRRSLRGRALVLAYHNIVPDDAAPSGDRPNHLSLSRFEAQIDHLAATHEVVPLEQLLHGSASDDRARVALTFDDAYRGAVALGVPALVKRGLPATIFVAPGLLGGKTFWWDEFSSGSNGLAPDFRDHALAKLAGDGAAIHSWALEQGGQSVAPLSCTYCRSATVEELDQAARCSGISLGSHTWSHPALTKVSRERLFEELRTSREWLQQQTTSIVDAIAYPYGIVDERVIGEAKRAGYRAGFRVDGGWIRGTIASVFDAPRLNVDPGLSTNGFALRLAGLLTG